MRFFFIFLFVVLCFCARARFCLSYFFGARTIVFPFNGASTCAPLHARIFMRATTCVILHARFYASAFTCALLHALHYMRATTYTLLYARHNMRATSVRPTRVPKHMRSKAFICVLCMRSYTVLEKNIISFGRALPLNGLSYRCLSSNNFLKYTFYFL